MALLWSFLLTCDALLNRMLRYGRFESWLHSPA